MGLQTCFHSRHADLNGLDPLNDNPCLHCLFLFPLLHARHRISLTFWPRATVIVKSLFFIKPPGAADLAIPLGAKQTKKQTLGGAPGNSSFLQPLSMLLSLAATTSFVGLS